jgi:signal peptidase I
MRRAAAAYVFLLLAVAVACSSGGGQNVMKGLGPLRPVRVKSCKHAAETAVDAALDANADTKTASKRKRRDLLRAIANAGIVMCEQSVHGVPWSRDAVQVFVIPSESMLPTIGVGDRVLLNKIAYKVVEPKRGDIVVHELPAAVATATMTTGIHRIVGLPGETIEGRDGHIWIDGQPLAEPYLPPRAESRTFGPEVIPPGRYYLLGDNRLYSKDSNFYGPVTRASILGPATVL